MRIRIISPGKQHDSTVSGGIKEFTTRLQTTYPIEWELPKGGALESEEKAMLQRILPDDYVVLLDERGKDISSPGLSELLTNSLEDGTKRLVFVIGGAFGVTEAIQKRADRTLKLSSLTLPHMLVRLLLIEQLYRAHTIRIGGKYHHE